MKNSNWQQAYSIESLASIDTVSDSWIVLSQITFLLDLDFEQNNCYYSLLRLLMVRSIAFNFQKTKSLEKNLLKFMKIKKKLTKRPEFCVALTPPVGDDELEYE